MSGNKHQSPCKICGSNFAWEKPYLECFGRHLDLEVTVCEMCEERLKNPSDTTSQEKAERRAKFRASIPCIFRETDRSRLPAILTEEIDAWVFGCQGLAFAGPSGKGKTRAMFLLLERLATEGKSVDFITATDFEHISRDQFSDDAIERNAAKEKLRSIRTVRILLLDDLGKSKFTDRCETELFAVFDTRTSEGLTTLWTSNLSARGLKAMVTPDRAEPLLRRLTEFTKIIAL